MADTIQVEIEALGAQGDGIATHEGQKVYIPRTLPGELVTVQPAGKQGDGMAADLRSVERASEDRAKARCKHFALCGGCSLQHMQTPAYLQFKAELVSRALAQRGLDDVPVDPPLAFGPDLRRRVTVAAKKRKGRVTLGFHERRGHNIVDATQCPVAHPDIVALFEPLRIFLNDLLLGGQGVSVAMTKSDTGIDMVIDAEFSLEMDMREKVADFALAQDLARITWGYARDEEPVIVLRAPIVTSHETKVALPTSVFLQASAETEAALVQFVMRETAQAQNIAELFSGCGTFSFPLASRAQVDAFDIDIGMVEAVRMALPPGQDATRLTTMRRDLFREPLTVTELNNYDTAVLDPPRAGARAQCEELAASDVADIVMVSCNPASFARDARILIDGGYQLDSIQPVDQFLWSPHIELMASFYR
jgi:23S rRNA (uracil1939-C5)-methyltransferase